MIRASESSIVPLPPMPLALAVAPCSRLHWQCEWHCHCQLGCADVCTPAPPTAPHPFDVEFCLCRLIGPSRLPTAKPLAASSLGHQSHDSMLTPRGRCAVFSKVRDICRASQVSTTLYQPLARSVRILLSTVIRNLSFSSVFFGFEHNSLSSYVSRRKSQTLAAPCTLPAGQVEECLDFTFLAS